MDKNDAFKQLRILQIIRRVIESSLSQTHAHYIHVHWIQISFLYIKPWEENEK